MAFSLQFNQSICLLKCGRAGCAISVGKGERNYFLCPRYHTSINILLEADEQQIFEVISLRGLALSFLISYR